MYIITATWYDNCGEYLLNEFFKDDMDEQNVLLFLEAQKMLFKHTVISRSVNTLVFSDGTRVCLQLCSVRESLIEDEKELCEDFEMDTIDTTLVTLN